jgi:hypothetical protein
VLNYMNFLKFLHVTDRLHLGHQLISVSCDVCELVLSGSNYCQVMYDQVFEVLLSGSKTQNFVNCYCQVMYYQL